MMRDTECGKYVTEDVYRMLLDMLHELGWSRKDLKADNHIFDISIAKDHGHADFSVRDLVAVRAEVRALRLLHPNIMPDFGLVPMGWPWKRT